MSEVRKGSEAQLPAAREVMDGYEIALQALASEQPDASTEREGNFSARGRSLASE